MMTFKGKCFLESPPWGQGLPGLGMGGVERELGVCVTMTVFLEI